MMELVKWCLRHIDGSETMMSLMSETYEREAESAERVMVQLKEELEKERKRADDWENALRVIRGRGFEVEKRGADDGSVSKRDVAEMVRKDGFFHVSRLMAGEGWEVRPPKRMEAEYVRFCCGEGHRRKNSVSKTRKSINK